MSSLTDRASILQDQGIFIGGSAQSFDIPGRKILMTLLDSGLYPNSTVLDIGCGCLRGGYWLIHFLDKDCYFGIEPDKEMLQAGVTILMEPEEIEKKDPKFDSNQDFDFTVFHQAFDFFVARSIWTHASKQQISTMLDGFCQTATENGVFLTSYIKASLLRPDYKGARWVGRSHESDEVGVVAHSLGWIQSECEKRGLGVQEILTETLNFGNQAWLKITRQG
jgi:SAM-dependent methyltransferase